MTPEQLLELVGIVLALGFAYLPWLKDKFDGLSPIWKPLVNALILAVVAYAAFGLTCLGFEVTAWVCSGAGALAVLWVVVQALFANQFAYAIGVKLPQAIKKANSKKK